MRVVARALLGVLGLLLAIVALTYVSGVLRQESSPAEQLVKDAPEPWVTNTTVTSPDLEDALRRSPAKSLSVAATLTVVAPGSSGDVPRAKLSLSITGPTSNPLLELVRQGHARGRGLALAWSVGVGTEVALPYGEPQISVSQGSTTVTLAATDYTRSGQLTSVEVVPVYQHCSALADRMIAVVGSGMVVSSVGAPPDPRQSPDGCAAGAWQDQTATRAVFRGMGAARIELVPDSATLPG
ncbi:hypothetical protein L3Q65_24350 [Amycolatopsis sp. FU40]|uniref:hypothetical protein n=1 Tax=Amycolatopsis sp. FU40 TaxID=2914159 RepID=UPI001F469E88|nr:hypothetical protein [Amycolatopsis sp. FU40]UKD51063.1 hypothetical protein L3Q65_24350 [Amycolatopsis sp. FU40]